MDRLELLESLAKYFMLKDGYSFYNLSGNIIEEIRNHELNIHQQGETYAYTLTKKVRPIFYLSSDLEVYRLQGDDWFKYEGVDLNSCTKPQDIVEITQRFASDILGKHKPKQAPYVIQQRYQDTSWESLNKMYASLSSALNDYREFCKKPVIYGSLRIIDANGNIVEEQYK